MATLGNTTSPPNGGYEFDDFGNCQFWDPYTMPAGGGIVTAISVYVAGHLATATVDFAVWGSTALLVHSGSFSLAADNHNPEQVRTQFWTTKALTPTYVPAGTVNLGFWTSGHVIWTGNTSGATNFQRSVGSIGSIAFGGSEGNALGVYITYTPGGIAHVRRTSSWHTGTVSDRRSSAWANARVRDRRTSTWVDAS